jgi:hypothetical protein
MKRLLLALALLLALSTGAMAACTTPCIQEAIGNNAGAGTTFAQAFASAQLKGHQNVVIVTFCPDSDCSLSTASSTCSLTDDEGNSYTTDNINLGPGGLDAVVCIFHVNSIIGGAAGNTVHVTASNPIGVWYLGANVSEWAAYGGGADVIGTTTVTATTSMSVSTASATTNPNDLVIAAMVGLNGSETLPSGYTAIDAGGNRFVYKTVTSTGTQSASDTFSMGDGMATIITFKNSVNQIFRHGQCSATATSCTLSAVATNDLVISFAYRNASVTPPTNPGGETSIASAATAASGTVGSYQVSCRLATSGSDTGSGSFTNATAVAAIAFTGARFDQTSNCNTNSIGVTATANAKTSATESYSSLASFTGVSGTSWVVAFDGDSASSHCAPTGLTSETSTGVVAGKDSEGTLTSWSTTTCSVTSGTWMIWIAEVRASVASTKTTNDTSGTGSGARAEASSRVYGTVRAAVDSLNNQISDLTARLYGAVRQPTEAGLINYWSARAFTGSRAASDSSGAASEVPVRVFSATRSSADSSAIASDKSSRSYGGARAASEISAPSGSEIAQRLASLARAVSDAAGPPSDKSSRLLAALRQVNDSSRAAEFGSRLVSNARTASDSILSSDLSARQLNSSRQFTESLFDSLLTGESAARQLVMSRSANDSINSFDRAARLGAFGRSIIEATGVVESSARSVGFTRGIYDTLIMLDNPTVSQGTIVISVDGNHRFTLAARNTLFSAVAKNYSFTMSVRPTSFNLNQRAVTFRLSPRITEFIYLGRQ